MSRTKVRPWTLRDPLLRKSHAHKAHRYVPDTDEELNEWLLEQQHHEDASYQADEENYYADES